MRREPLRNLTFGRTELDGLLGVNGDTAIAAGSNCHGECNDLVHLRLEMTYLVAAAFDHAQAPGNILAKLCKVADPADQRVAVSVVLRSRSALVVIAAAAAQKAIVGDNRMRKPSIKAPGASDLLNFSGVAPWMTVSCGQATQHSVPK